MRRPVLVAVLVGLVAAGCAHSHTSYSVDQPSFHSAGPGAQEEIQSVLDAQARSIATGDWSALLAMFIPTERSRCTLTSFAEISEQSFAALREQVRAWPRRPKLTAKMSDLHLEGFRALVNYQFVLPAVGLSTTAQTSHYLKLGDRWFIDEKAC